MPYIPSLIDEWVLSIVISKKVYSYYNHMSNQFFCNDYRKKILIENMVNH